MRYPSSPLATTWLSASVLGRLRNLAQNLIGFFHWQVRGFLRRRVKKTPEGCGPNLRGYVNIRETVQGLCVASGGMNHRFPS